MNHEVNMPYNSTKKINNISQFKWSEMLETKSGLYFRYFWIPEYFHIDQ